jgi:hypothetical protein
MMLRKRGRKSAGMALVAGFLMGFSAILHPEGAQTENVRDETRRKKDAQLGEPVETGLEHDGASGREEA